MLAASPLAHLHNNGPEARIRKRAYSPTYPCLSLSHLKCKYNISNRTKTSANYWHIAQNLSDCLENEAVYIRYSDSEFLQSRNSFSHYVDTASLLSAFLTDKLVTENKLTTLMITHNMHDAIAYGNRLIMMHEGQVVVDVSGEEKKEYKARVKAANRKWMIACLLVNFGLLAICKAALVEPFRALMNGTGLSFLTLGLPMGISFYMFQSMGYVVDVYRGTCKAEKDFFRLALFVSFFPQLVQGPISKFTQLAPTLYAPKDFDGKTVSFGLQRMLWGYFKKLVVADRIAVAIGTLKGAEYTGVGFLLLSLFYAVQIYGDFTGGIDVTIGLAETSWN